MLYEIYPREAWELCQSLGLERSITMAERDKIDDADFAWPDAPDHPKYPIDTQAHLDAAAKLIGHAPKDKQAEIKARAIKIAKRHGLKLPESWQEDEKGKPERSIAASPASPATSENAPHPPMTGRHSHGHSHMDGYDHEHPHEHHNDNVHDHSHDHSIHRAASQTSDGTSQGEYHALYMPVSYMSRRDSGEWIVEGQATAEVPDSFGTIFTYDASKGAFQRWLAKYANCREMHGKKAAGKGIDATFDDQNRRVMVRTRVSKGAPDTWIKFHEGVLNGFSVGATNVKMGRMTYQGKSYPAILSYDLAELSYVDAPSCPGSDAYIVARADGNLSEIIDDSDHAEKSAIQAIITPEEERIGKTVSKDTQKSMHGAISGVLKGAKAMMDTCAAGSGCSICAKASSMLDPDNDGDIDWLGINDPDNDAQQLGVDMQERMQQTLERSLAPVYQRQQTFLARLSQFDTHYAAIQQQLEELKTLQGQLSQLAEIKAVLERVATASTLDEVRAEVEHVKDRVKKMEDQPAPGGPVMNGARPGAGPYDKTNPYQPQQNSTASRAQIERETIERLHASGAFQTTDDQVAAAALMIRPMQGMR